MAATMQVALTCRQEQQDGTAGGLHSPAAGSAVEQQQHYSRAGGLDLPAGSEDQQVAFICRHQAVHFGSNSRSP
jgi:hypothetical protein